MAVEIGTRWGCGSRHSVRQRMCQGKQPIEDVTVDGVTYPAIWIAEGLADAMERQKPEWLFSYYQCLFCPHMHIGRIARRQEAI